MMNEFDIWVEIEKLIDDLQGIFRRKKGNVGNSKKDTEADSRDED